MSTDHDAELTPEQKKGPISWMARNSVAANLLMFVILAAGLIGLTRIKQEVFPEFDLDIVSVSVPYPGASPEEVEQGIVLAIEEAVRGIDGVKRIKSTAAEGAGAVTVELQLEANPDKVLADVKSAVDRIRTFPEDSERPKVSLLSRSREVISLIISGDQDLRTLHALAEKARAGLLARPDVTLVKVDGVPPLEVAIEVRRSKMESLGLTMEDVSRAVSASSLELPGGAVDTSSGEILVRVSDRALALEDFTDIVLRSTPQGATVRLGDVADVRDGYAETDQSAYFNGEPAVRVTVYRVGAETPSSVAEAARDFSSQFREELPASITLTPWNDQSELLTDRIDLLVRNARVGLVLVMVILALFLELRLAIWVALGIPISFLGAFLLMPSADISVNMISLFALIVTLGMVVDDAIVVGEAAYSKMQEGMAPAKAAIVGAQEMAMPVTFAILTTIASFSPLFIVPGVMGKIFRILPMVIVAVLLFSLVESFFILPAHLAHGASAAPPRGIWKILDRPRKFASGWLDRFTHSLYKPALQRVLEWRYAALGLGLALMAVTFGLIGGGIVQFSFFPKIEGDIVTVSARLPYGAPVHLTEEVKANLEASARATLKDVGGESILKGIYSTVGQGPVSGGPGGGGFDVGGHLATVQVYLVPTEQRDLTSQQFSERWAELTPEMAGLEALSFESNSGPGAGAAVDVLLSHPDTDTLAAASGEVSHALRGYSDLTDIESSYAAGKAQLDYRLKPEARSLGLTSVDLARQLRANFFGAEAVREQRGRNELKVMVRLPRDQRASEFDLEQLQIRTPSGAFVPLSAVASLERGRAPTVISREDGRKNVNVTGGLAPGVKSSQVVIASLEDEVLPDLRSRYPGLRAELAGEQREQGETFKALGQNYILALFVMYALLAVPFRSYLQPIVIMSAIPFGIVGAILGHLLMQYNLSIISMFGIVALGGVVVNDSLVLMDAANRKRATGATPWEAISYAGARRLRPILLTSLTTFFGLAPMIFETSIQARFLIPMAISLGFGVLFATFIVLLLVPGLYLIVEDVRDIALKIWRKIFPPDEPTQVQAHEAAK